MNPAMGRLLLIAVMLITAACDDLDEFRVQGEETFGGAVVGSDGPDDGGTASGCNFVLCGFPERTTLTLRDFDPNLAGGAPTGNITTADGTFDHAALMPIPGLEHDALSEYTFPGGGRIRNFMFGARFGADDSRYAVVFVSLMENGRIEARVHAPSTTGDADDALFGVFRLCRGGCAR
jgi:hypothetical protein